MPRPGEVFHMMTRRSASLYGRGRSSNALVMLKMAVFAPMPIASDRIAATVKPGLFLKARKAYRRSRARVDIADSYRNMILLVSFPASIKIPKGLGDSAYLI